MLNYVCVFRPSFKKPYVNKGNFKKSFKKFNTKKKYNKKCGMVSKTVTFKCPSLSRLQMFPDVYRATAHSQLSNSLSLATASTDQIYQIQVFSTGIHLNLSEMTNRSGTLSSPTSIVPAGIAYLLGDPNSGGTQMGGVAPYITYRILRSWLKVTWMPATLVLSAINPQPSNCVTEVCINFSNEPLTTYYNINNSNLTEQPYAKHKIYPAYSTEVIPPLVNGVDTLELWGDRYKSSIEGPAFVGTYNSSPSNNTYAVVSIYTLGANANNFALNGSYIIDVFQEYEFFGRNPFNSFLPN